MPCDICCNKYMYDIVKYNCGHTFHKKCLLVNNMSLINPMCIKCKNGKKFTVKKYEDDEDDFDEDDSDEYDSDESDSDESDEYDSDYNDDSDDGKKPRDFPITFIHVCLAMVSIISLFLAAFR